MRMPLERDPDDATGRATGSSSYPIFRRTSQRYPLGYEFLAVDDALGRFVGKQEGSVEARLEGIVHACRYDPAAEGKQFLGAADSPGTFGCRLYDVSR